MSRYLVPILLLFIFQFQTVLADCGTDDLTNVNDKLGKLDFMFNVGCFGGAKDSTLLTKTVTTDLQRITIDAVTESELAERRDRLLGLLIRIEGSLDNAMTTMDDTWSEYARIVINELALAKDELRNFESTIRVEHWKRGQEYGFFEQPTTGVFLISYEADIDQACQTVVITSECRIALESLIVLTRHIYLAFQVMSNPVRARLELIHAELVKLDAEWDYYFNDARSQFWWEFMANNAFYDPAGNKLARPPVGQLILFHPSVAMEYVSSNITVESAYNLVGIIDVIGYNRLRWTEEGPFSKWPLGASFVATYVPATPGDDFGYGIMFHVRNNLSFGATRRDTGAGDETTWLLSVDLMRLFLDKSTEAKKEFRSIK